MNRRTITLVFLVSLASFVFAFPRLSSNAFQRLGEEKTKVAPRRNAKSTTPRGKTSSEKTRQPFSAFSHRTPQHQKDCASCHTAPTENWTRVVRESGEAFPDVTDYPDHPSCVNCHRREFFSGARPTICAICHTNVSPRDGTRFPFQNPKENFEASRSTKKTFATEFGLNFPHDKHQDVMAQIPASVQTATDDFFVRASFMMQGAQKKIDSCSICHQTYQPENDSAERYVVKPPLDLPKDSFWLKKGTFKTTPQGHASCFNCHWQDGGEKPLSSDCAGCHKLLPSIQTSAQIPTHTDADAALAARMNLNDPAMLAAWLRRHAATFRHEETKHESVGCTSCHINISSINRLDAQTLHVPLLTCGGGGTGCHIKATIPKKILNLEVEKRRDDSSFRCAKCHINYGTEAIPQTHLDAVSVAKPK